MRARSAVLVVFVFAALDFTGFFPGNNNPNELSRIEAVVAFVESGTFSIDSVIPRLGDSLDKSVWGGRYYSNKAPGLIFAAIPVYRLLRIVFPPPEKAWAFLLVLVRLATVSLASVVALTRFLRSLENGPAGEKSAPMIAFAAAFGTPFLYYSHSFFSHAWTASLLFLSWDCLRGSQTRRGSGASLAAAGLLAGWAAISEYTAAPVAAILAVRAIAGSARRARTLLLFVAGAAPALALLAIYDAVCFGSPFRLSSACEAFPAYTALAHLPLFGIGVPSPRIAMATLFSSTRGAILFSPFLLWSVGGFVGWWRSGRDRADLWTSLAAVALIWIPIAGYPNWDGGWSLGMRYLIPGVFFAAAAIPWALTTRTSRAAFLAAVVFSAAFHGLASSTWPHFPASIRWPVANVSAWLLARGAVAPNFGLLLGLPAAISVAVVLIAVAIAFALCAREMPVSRPGPLAASLAGLLIFALSLVAPPAVSSADARWREETAQKLQRLAVAPGVGRYNQWFQ